MATVSFNSSSEFLHEVERDRLDVDRKVMRVTFRFSRDIPISSVAVVATAVIAGHVVELVERIGSYMAETVEEKRVLASAEATAKRIEDAAVSYGLEVRRGTFRA